MFLIKLMAICMIIAANLSGKQSPSQTVKSPEQLEYEHRLEALLAKLKDYETSHQIHAIPEV